MVSHCVGILCGACGINWYSEQSCRSTHTMSTHSRFSHHTTRITSGTFIRNLPYSMLERIARQLDPDGTSTTWRDLALHIPQSPLNSHPRYTTSDIQQFEMASRQGKSPTLSVLSSWSTTNATAEDLVRVFYAMNLPKLAEMIMPRGGVADYRHPSPHGYDTAPPSYEVATGAAQPSTNVLPQLHTPNPVNSSSLNQYSSGTFERRRREPIEHASITPRRPTENEIETTLSPPLSLEGLNLEKNLPSFPYSNLSELTFNFNDSCKLGEGAFGSVFSGHIDEHSEKFCNSTSRKIAIKRLKLDGPDLAVAVAEQFKKEIHIISELKHKNILPLVGYSCDGPELCLVYDFMFNGSLSSNLACCREGTSKLTVGQRVKIAEGSAAGIDYLHGKKLVHRDIKSSNILLDMEIQPKISDFGLIRSVNSSSRDKTSTMTTNPIGTPMYMAPEAYRGEVSPAMDVYGFGIVLLELLTSRAVHDEDRDPPSLESYVTEKCDEEIEIILDLVDKEAGHWGRDLAIAMYELATGCLEYRRKKRPNMAKVHQTIHHFSLAV